VMCGSPVTARPVTMASIRSHPTHLVVVSGWLREQRAHAGQIKHRRGEDEGPVDACATAVPQLAQQTDGLQPAEALLDQFPLLLAKLASRPAGHSGGLRQEATRESKKNGGLARWGD
jgi:hypothetical protein